MEFPKKIQTKSFVLKDLDKINVILGKNGCGKSTTLREVEAATDLPFGKVSYVSPERPGSLKYDPNIDNNIRSNDTWLGKNRRKNQSTNFKQQTAAIFNRLLMRVLRKFHDTEDKKHKIYPMEEAIDSLLDNITFKIVDDGFKFFSAEDSDNPLDPEKISSGESELIALSIEVLEFLYSAKDENNLLLLDEPDVHIHPDLQRRFATFLNHQIKDSNCQVIIATHSTALLAAFAEMKDSRVSFMRPKQNEISFRPLSTALKSVIPVFGAHPLSQVFNDDPPIIVEGEDDHRIWSTVVRSSQGKARLFPVVSGSKEQIKTLEDELLAVLPSIYDNPKCYSLRDGDGLEESLSHILPLKRFRLSCYEAENLLLSDEIIAKFGFTWETFKNKLESWLSKNADHPKFSAMQSFSKSGFDRKNHKIKELRLIIVDLLGQDKPWEIIVGQAIAGAIMANQFPNSEHGLREYLGAEFVKEVLGVS